MNIYKKVLRTLFSVCICANAIVCYAAGDEHVENKNVHNLSVEQLIHEAETGNAEAQVKLGLHYEEGNGVQQDFDESIRLWQLAAQRQHPRAEFLLGIAYYQGNGVEENLAEAYRWWQRAAEHGHPEAQFVIGMAEFNGRGRTVSRDTAIAWFEKGAAQGNENCQEALKYLPAQSVDYSEGAADYRFRIMADMADKPTQFSLLSNFKREIADALIALRQEESYLPDVHYVLSTLNIALEHLPDRLEKMPECSAVKSRLEYDYRMPIEEQDEILQSYWRVLQQLCIQDEI